MCSMKLKESKEEKMARRKMLGDLMRQSLTAAHARQREISSYAAKTIANLDLNSEELRAALAEIIVHSSYATDDIHSAIEIVDENAPRKQRNQ